MLLSTKAFTDEKVLPFIVQKNDKKNPEGNYVLHLFSRVVITQEGKKYVKKFRFLPLRYEKELARFKTRKEAIEYGRYRVGLDPEPTK